MISFWYFNQLCIWRSSGLYLEGRLFSFIMKAMMWR